MDSIERSGFYDSYLISKSEYEAHEDFLYHLSKVKAKKVKRIVYKVLIIIAIFILFCYLSLLKIEL